jgi:D-amino peptidase
MSGKSKKVFISIDMEGISGIVGGGMTGGDPKEYEYGRRLMVGDLNAAIEGALDSGAKEIVVSDAHGWMTNVQPEEVNEAAYLIRGTPKPDLMMSGIGDEFDAALYVGYHSMKGTENGVLAHTIAGGIVDGMFVNGRETGEFGLNAALAGWYGVPSVFISGDNAVAVEAKSFVPNIKATIVKWGVSRVAAKCLHPKTARKLIKETVTEALADADNIEPFRVDEPVEVKLRYVNSTMADAAAVLPYIERTDGRTVKAVFNNYPEATRGLLAAINIGSTVTLRQMLAQRR